MSSKTEFIRPPSSASSLRDTLPTDLSEIVLRRIVTLCLFPPGLVILGNLVNLVTSYLLRITSFDYTLLEAGHDVLITLVSVSLAWIVHKRKYSTRALMKLGLAFCVFTALWFSVTECLVVSSYASTPIRLGISYFSFPMIWVVFFPAIIPIRSRTVGLTIVLAALTSPLVRWLAQSFGWVQFPEGSVTFVAIAMLFSVALGISVSRVVYALGKSVSDAREMGSYTLEKNLGDGGMGEVWLASHRLLARPAAVKFIKPEVLVGMDAGEIEKMNQRFEHEVQATATLQSPHTVDIYDYGLSQDGTFFYVMELLDGIDMETLVKRFGPVEPSRAVYLLCQACHSLNEAHKRHLIHRDIKPANLFVCKYGEDADFVKVLDFGLVKNVNVGGEADLKLTTDGSITGTPAYIYPEAVSGKGPVDHRSDIYSLGCVAYWLLTGHLVFTAKTSLAMLMEHANADPVPPSQRSEMQIPEDLDKIILDCLAKDPGDRPQGADELASRLGNIDFSNPWNEERAQAWWELHHGN